MRLINITTFEMKEWFEGDVQPYAILSHTWGDQEISFQDWQTIASFPEVLAARPSGEDDTYAALQRRKVDALKQRAGYRKIIDFCHAVLTAGDSRVQWVWVDTCCIDKTSSSEFSEAINSMFRWYEGSVTCYVYLADVSPHLISSLGLSAALRTSRWFTRGWTLQELLAPNEVTFLSAEWTQIGKKKYDFFRAFVSEITGIQDTFLRSATPINQASISNRMSWASKRETTRIEDQAYCLLGIFGIHMPLLYGEGKHAFPRLQEEILKSSTDLTIFAWGFDSPIADGSGILHLNFSQLLASSPADFKFGSELVQGSHHRSEHPFQMTNKGLNITLEIARWGSQLPPLYFASFFRPWTYGGSWPGFLVRHIDDDNRANTEISNGDVLLKFPAGGPFIVDDESLAALGSVVERSIFIPRYSATPKRGRRGFPSELRLQLDQPTMLANQQQW